MSWLCTGLDLEPSNIADNFRWSDLRTGHVVDVGGSLGSISIALARRFPSLRFVVQDQLDMVKAGRENLLVDLLDRVSFLEHDFFTPQPIKDADVYLLRWILHDWSDGYAVKILRALIPALKTDDKVLVCETIVPEPGTVSPYQERDIR